jgi:hypothetical protein
MRTTMQSRRGAIFLFLSLSLSSCATAPPECKPVVQTQTVTVYRDRYITPDPKSIAPEVLGPPALPLTNKSLDAHDAECVAALRRANTKLEACAAPASPATQEK